MSNLISYTVGFLIDPMKQWIILIEKKHPVWQTGLLNGPGGKIERGESPLTCMAREFEEETLVKVAEKWWREKVVLIGPGFQIHFFVAKAWLNVLQAVNDQSKKLPPNAEKAAKFSMEFALSGNSKIIKNLRWLIPMCIDDDFVWHSALNVNLGQKEMEVFACKRKLS